MGAVGNAPANPQPTSGGSQTGRGPVTPGGGSNEHPGCRGTTGQPACLWLELRQEGPQATSQGSCGPCLLGAPGRSAAPFTGGCHILTFPWGRRWAVGAVWQGWLGRLCTQRWKETPRTFLLFWIRWAGAQALGRRRF